MYSNQALYPEWLVIEHFKQHSFKYFAKPRPQDKSAYQKIIYLISQPKHMLWALKRTISMRLFFCAPKTYVLTDG